MNADPLKKCRFYKVNTQNFYITQIIYELVSFQLQSILAKTLKEDF